jgi:hypothetical protein
MKYLKMLGLAAIAAMGLMAFVGAGTASATVLCTATETPCSTAHEISPSNDQHLVATQTGTGILEEDKAVNPATLVTCSGSELTALSTKTGGTVETPTAEVKTLDWSGCTSTVTTVATGSLEIHHIEGTDNGTVTSSGTEVTTAILGVSCTFKGTDLGTLTGGTSPVMDINATVDKTAGSFVCPAHATWTATYNITTPTPLYVET